MKLFAGICAFVFLILCCSLNLAAQTRRKVIIDQDAAGPGGTDMQAILALVNSPGTDVLGITVLTGGAWPDEEVEHTLRLMGILGCRGLSVGPGTAVSPGSRQVYIANGVANCG